MSETLIKKIEEMLHEEKWTRTAIGAYTVNHIKELDTVIESVWGASIHDEVFEITEHHLLESKNSIIALYLAGMIGMKKQLLDDTYLVRLVNLFSQNLKWNVVEYICERILSYGENKFALRTLIECYKNENQEDEIQPIMERLIKVDMDEAELPLLLAQKAEKEKNPERAIEYYKKSIHRFLHKKNFNRIREIWLRLMDLVPEETEYFNQVELKVGKSLGFDKALQLLEDLFPVFSKREDWDTVISLLLKIHSYDNKTSWVRKEIIECLRKKHSDNPQLEEYVRLSNIQDSWKNLSDALEDFKKHMAYEKGNFVFHKTWGVGLIRDIRGQEFVIDFELKRNQVMAQKMAVEALISLSKDDIRVIKAIMKKDELKAKIKESVEWSLKTIIKSFDNCADMKLIKAVLTPSVLSASEWSSWSTAARNLLKTRPEYAAIPDKKDHFMVRSQQVTAEEKAYNMFKSEKDFFKKVTVLNDFLEVQDGETDDFQGSNVESEYFMEIFNHFVGLAKSQKINEEVVSSHLLVQSLVKKYPHLNPGITRTFEEILSDVERPEVLYTAINNADLKREFLVQVKLNLSNWPDLFSRLFPLSPQKSIIEDLVTSGRDDVVKEMFSDIVEKYKEFKEPFVWIVRLLWDSSDFDKLSVSPEKLLINLIHLLEITYREINNKKDVINNKKISRQLQQFLFKESNLSQFLEEAKIESVSRIYSLINDVKEIPANDKQELRTQILSRFPELAPVQEEKAKNVSVRKGILATKKMYNLKVKELQHIVDVEVPHNSKEIGEAMALGDLKENAEYHAAKEKQTLLSAATTTLTKEIESATVIEPTDIDITKIMFGTVVSLKNNSDGKTEKYTILGPWESNPEKNIISYLSPFGDKLLGNKVSENIKFTINERKCDYVVLSIDLYKF